VSTDPQTSTAEPTSRRDALSTILWSTLGVVVLPILYIAGRFLKPPPPAMSMIVAGAESELGAGSARIVKVGSTDAIVMRDDAGALYALNLRCTHAGCNVRWREGERIFACPCHGGRFAADGGVLKGPPKVPLERLEVRIESGSVIVTDTPA
jgi:cytochrome b6-f complex iron-sulfur subunit